VYGAYGWGNGTIWIDDIACSGSEEGLSQCLHRGWGVHDCRHYEDASVICDSKLLYVVCLSVCLYVYMCYVCVFIFQFVYPV